MEMPVPWCGIRYDRGEREGEEEELTLTPHHTPSQSFDFIVWEKAYLDNIPAASSSKDAPPPANPNFDECEHGLLTLHATSMCGHRPSSGPSSSSLCVHISSSHNPKLSLSKESLPIPPLQTPSSTLMACRTDADLPPSFIIDKPRSSGAGLTSLEEAVRSYARMHPHTIGSPTSPTSHCNTKHCSHCGTGDTQLAQLNVNHEAALLRRSISQPGGGTSKGLSSCVGFKKPIASKSSLAADSAVFGHAQIYQDRQYYAVPVPPPPPPTRNHSKWSCFPASPGRRKRPQSDCEATQMAEILESPTLDQLHWQQERLRSPVDKRQQQNYKLLSPAAWVDAMHMRTGRHVPAGWTGKHVDMRSVVPGSDQSSLSDMSSDGDRRHDTGAAAALNMSKLKLWGLHHRFKALCKKLCSFCTL